MMKRSPNEWADAVVSALTDAFAGNLDPMAELVDPNIVIHEPPYLPYGRDFSGTSGFLELFNEAIKVIDTSTLKIITSVANEDRVVLLMSARFFGCAEDTLVTEHWVIRDEKISDVTVFWFSLPPQPSPSGRP